MSLVSEASIKKRKMNIRYGIWVFFIFSDQDPMSLTLGLNLAISPEVLSFGEFGSHKFPSFSDWLNSF